MSLTLPSIVADYFAAANRADVAAVAACFTVDAVVTDENRQHRGRAAIANWQQAAGDKYQVQLAPRAIAPGDGGCVVTATASGNFKGSPLDLRFQFSLADAAITQLEITV